jgi:sortase A
MTGLRTLARRLAPVAMTAGVLMLGYVALVIADARAYESAFHAREAAARADPIASPAPAPLVEGAAIGEIRIERLGVSAVIGQGDSTTVLRRGVGHLADTAWLGQAGNVALAGHRDTVFRALRGIRLGDLIEVSTLDHLVRYEVESTTVVPPTNLAVLAASDSNSLTLITCYPFDFIGAAPKRFIVRAREIR